MANNTDRRRLQMCVKDCQTCSTMYTLSGDKQYTKRWATRTCHFCITFDFEDESYICYAFWVPYEVYIKDFSKFHHFTPVLSSWWFSIHLLELKIQMSRIPPCHTSKVASWHVDYWYDLHLWSSLSKIWLKVSKTGQNSCYLQYCQFLPLFETLSQILLREDHKWSSYQ